MCTLNPVAELRNTVQFGNLKMFYQLVLHDAVVFNMTVTLRVHSVCDIMNMVSLKSA